MPEAPRYPRISTIKSAADFRTRLAALGAVLPCDDEVLQAPSSPLGQPLQVCGRRLGNRFAVQPMEGWDGTEDGLPTDYTRRRWANFGRSGAKLIWGCEACAVVPEGRANPHQLMVSDQTAPGLVELLTRLRDEHRQACGTVDDLLVGLQLTHSGRFCRPSGRLEPIIAYRHPILDRKFGLSDDHPPVSDDYLDRLVDRFVGAARLARQLGFDFVDVKHCHGYLLHELLGARTRPGRYGGSLENRARFLREVVAGIRAEVPGLAIGVRLSLFDMVPFHPDPADTGARHMGRGIPETWEDCLPYHYGFGVAADQPDRPDLSEPLQFVDLMVELGVELLNLSAGSPYYNPHIQRPALFPPSDGYQPPEDPLVGVARQVQAAAVVKARHPSLPTIGTGYTYLQEFLPLVGQAVVRAGMIDFVGLGRMVLSYPELPRDVLEHGRLDRRRLCRTFSHCTTGPRQGMVSGCYPLDPFYRALPEAARLKDLEGSAP